MDERQESSFSDRTIVSTFLRYKRGPSSGKQSSRNVSGKESGSKVSGEESGRRQERVRRAGQVETGGWRLVTARR